MTDVTSRTAAELAHEVRTGALSPVEVVRAHLERIDAVEPAVGAFRRVRADEALAEAAALADRDDLGDLPLAGVPVAVKDNVGVAGEVASAGGAFPAAVQDADHPVVARLRAAGAVVIGVTRMPELGIWPFTEGTRNPWARDRTPGGSSGGSAAAVAAAMVPVAHGNDGLGSIRIPAACCGLVGIKPGTGVVPAEIGPTSWYGMTENGPLATTVQDAAAMLAVLADRPGLADLRPAERRLRIAVSWRPPLPGLSVDREWKAAAVTAARGLEAAGAAIERDDPPLPFPRLVPALLRWYAGAWQQAGGADAARLQPRTRAHVRAGRLTQRFVRAGQADRFREAVAGFFQRYDVLLTPSLAAPPPEGEGWESRSWLANLNASTVYAPMNAPWNLAGFPAAAVPAGRHPDGTPLSVQLVAPAGGEALLLTVARLLEEAAPWPRHAPL